MKRYAIIDENNMCIGNAQAPSEINADNYIELKDGEVVGPGYIWNGETWKYGELPMPETPEHTQLDRMEEKIDTLVNGTTNENTEAINALFGE